MYFWISWCQPTEDHRPLTYPPNSDVLGWWNTGIGSDGHTIVSVVKADDEKTAKEVVKKDWPEADKWRFCALCEPYENLKLGDRFPLSDWMKPRFEAEQIS